MNDFAHLAICNITDIRPLLSKFLIHSYINPNYYCFKYLIFFTEILK